MTADCVWPTGARSFSVRDRELQPKADSSASMRDQRACPDVPHLGPHVILVSPVVRGHLPLLPSPFAIGGPWARFAQVADAIGIRLQQPALCCPHPSNPPASCDSG